MAAFDAARRAVLHGGDGVVARHRHDREIGHLGKSARLGKQAWPCTSLRVGLMG